MKKRREENLQEEIYTIVFRLMQLKDSQNLFPINGIHQVITSICSNGKELSIPSSLKKINIATLKANEIKVICLQSGYTIAPRGSKNTITLNQNKIYIRSQNYTNRPLINHSSRDKYLKICNKIGVSIAPLDKMINEYWRKRKLGIINEDVENRSEYSPFANHKEELKPILTYMFFNGIKSNEEQSADFILDYSDPADENTWRIYDKEMYIDKIWDHLRFSFRADRGMPVGYSPNTPQFIELHPWVEYWNNQYKGALHIRVSAFNSNTPKESAFIIRHRKDIKELESSKNKGELDEIIIKIFFIESRMKQRPLPLGKEICTITSVGHTPDSEYSDLPFCADWTKLSIVEIVGIINKCNISKAGSYDKADVYVNKIGISLKSHRGASPSIINQTKRSSILRIMETIHQPIFPLDNMINRYWDLRLSKIIGEDIQNTNPNSPFGGVDGYEYLLPLLNYFVFDGTGTKDSARPAELVLVFTDPINQHTWKIYNRDNYIATIWKKLTFAMRGKGLPEHLSNEDKLWIRNIDEEKKGTFNVRVKK